MTRPSISPICIRPIKPRFTSAGTELAEGHAEFGDHGRTSSLRPVCERDRRSLSKPSCGSFGSTITNWLSPQSDAEHPDRRDRSLAQTDSRCGFLTDGSAVSDGRTELQADGLRPDSPCACPILMAFGSAPLSAWLGWCLAGQPDRRVPLRLQPARSPSANAHPRAPRDTLRPTRCKRPSS